MRRSECSRRELRSEAQFQIGPFRSRNNVLATRVSEGMILLDCATERYLTLNYVAADIWKRLVAGMLPVEIVNELLLEYDAPREQIASDVRLQIEDLLANGLMESIDVPAGPTSPPPTSDIQSDLPVRSESLQKSPSETTASRMRPVTHLQCLLLLAEAKLRLAWQGYERTLHWVGRSVERVPVTDNASMGVVRAIEYTVAMTAALYPGRAKCLERSLVLYRILRRQGVAVRYCQGVQPFPFQAHAWVEYRGEVINDVPEHAAFFARLPEQLP